MCAFQVWLSRMKPAARLRASEREKPPEIAGEGVSSLRLWQEGVGGELPNLDPVIEHQVGFDPGVREKEITRQLRQFISIGSHVSTFLPFALVEATERLCAARADDCTQTVPRASVDRRCKP